MQQQFKADDLANYMALRNKVDAYLQAAATRHARHIACQKGCCSCCRHISVFPVEAAALHLAMADIPASEAVTLRNLALSAGADDPCPLLANGLCRLYAARPIICRTHGLPIYIMHKDTPAVDCCPLNFKGVTTFPQDSLIDLENLNQLLAAVNHVFLENLDTPQPPGRLSIAEAILGDDDAPGSTKRPPAMTR